MESKGRAPVGSFTFIRKKLIINLPVQLGILFYSLFVAAASIFCIYVFQWIFTNNLIELPGLGYVRSRYLVVVPSMVLTLIFAWGIMLTNRIAGPMYALKKHLMAVNDGDTKKVFRLRGSDYFHELVEPMNQLTAKLSAAESKKS